MLVDKYLVLAFMLRNDRDQAGIQIVGLVRNKQKAKKIYGQLTERTDLELVEADVCGDLSKLAHCDYVIHAASQATPYFFENDPVGTMEANTLGTSNILRYAVKEKPEAPMRAQAALSKRSTLMKGCWSFRTEKRSRSRTSSH